MKFIPIIAIFAVLAGVLIPNKSYAIEAAQTPEAKLSEAIAAARANVSSNPMSWRAVNALGITLFQAHKYTQSALVFEQAIAMFPISSAAETEQQAKEARQLAIKAQKDADARVQQQQKDAQEQMQEQQMLSGMLSMLPMMPGATQGTMLLAQAGQTMINAAYTPSGMSLLSGPTLQENESSQVQKARELATLYANLGQSRMALWEEEAALEAFRQAYSTDPSRIDLLFMQASILQRDNDLAGAIMLNARYMAAAPEAKQPIAWIEIAESCRDLGLEKEKNNALALARKTWTRLLGQSTSPTTERGFADILTSAGFYRESLPYLQTWFNASQKDFTTKREWAIALFRAGKMEEGQQIINSLPDTSDRGFSAYFKGMIEFHSGHFDEAKKILEKLKPEPGATSGFAIAAYAMCGHLEEERAWINKIENGLSSPDTPEVDWYRLGCVWLITGNIPKAAECASRAIEFQPEFGPALLLKEQLMELQSEQIKSESLQASQAASNGDMATAVKILSETLTNMPSGKTSAVLTLEGMKYVSNLQSPLRMSKEAQQYYLRGQAILKNAKTQQSINEALCQYQWALRYAPLSPEIHLSLSSVYATQKQFKKSLFHIEAYLSASQSSGNLDAIIERYYELQYLNDDVIRKISTIIPEIN